MVLEDVVSLTVAMGPDWCYSNDRDQSSLLTCVCVGQPTKFDLPPPPRIPGPGEDDDMMNWKAFVIAGAIVAGAVFVMLIVTLLFFIYRRYQNSQQATVSGRSQIYYKGDEPDTATINPPQHNTNDNNDVMKIDNPIYNQNDSSLSNQANVVSLQNAKDNRAVYVEHVPPQYHSTGNTDNIHRARNTATSNDSKHNGDIHDDFPLNKHPPGQEDADSMESGFEHADSGMLWRKQNWQFGNQNSAYL